MLTDHMHHNFFSNSEFVEVLNKTKLPVFNLFFRLSISLFTSESLEMCVESHVESIIHNTPFWIRFVGQWLFNRKKIFSFFSEWKKNMMYYNENIWIIRSSHKILIHFPRIVNGFHATIVFLNMFSSCCWKFNGIDELIILYTLKSRNA